MFEIPLGAHDLELRFANMRATSLPGDDETEYSKCSSKLGQTVTQNRGSQASEVFRV